MKRRWAIIISLSVLLWSHSGVFAQDCPACDMPPPHLQMYEGVMSELISYIETTPKSWSDGGTWRVALAITSALDATLTSTALARILPLHVMWDVFGSLQMLAGSQTLVRDWETLIRIDRNIGIQTLSMIQWSRNNDPMPDAVLAKIDGSLKKLWYVSLRKGSNGAYIMKGQGKNWATYWELAMLLRQLNFFYKQLHLSKRYNPELKDVGVGYWKTDKDLDDAGAESFDKEDVQKFILQTNAMVDQTFAPLYGFFKWPAHEWLDFGETNKYADLYLTIWTIQQQYECSIGLLSECSEWKEIREESLALAKDRIINDGENAIRTFKDARWRLKGALWWGSAADQNAANQRKQALTYSQRWIIAWEEKRKLLEVDTHIEPAPYSVSSLWKNISKARKKKSDTLGEDELFDPNSSAPSNQPLANSQKDAQLYEDDPMTILQQQMDELAKQPQDKYTQAWVWIKNSSSQIVLEQQSQRLQQTFLSVLSAQGNMQEKSIFTDVKRTTHRFPILSAVVYKNINIIGDKNDKGRLQNAMGTVCEQQCSNLGPTCRYITQ